jgi:hypothetical protein
VLVGVKNKVKFGEPDVVWHYERRPMLEQFRKHVDLIASSYLPVYTVDTAPVGMPRALSMKIVKSPLCLDWNAPFYNPSLGTLMKMKFIILYFTQQTSFKNSKML